MNLSCLHCGAEFDERKSKRKAKFCNNVCQQAYQWKKFCKFVVIHGYFPNMTAYDSGGSGKVNKVKRFLKSIII